MSTQELEALLQRTADLVFSSRVVESESLYRERVYELQIRQKEAQIMQEMEDIRKLACLSEDLGGGPSGSSCSSHAAGSQLHPSLGSGLTAQRGLGGERFLAPPWGASLGGSRSSTSQWLMGASAGINVRTPRRGGGIALAARAAMDTTSCSQANPYLEGGPGNNLEMLSPASAGEEDEDTSFEASYARYEDVDGPQHDAESHFLRLRRGQADSLRTGGRAVPPMRGEYRMDHQPQVEGARESEDAQQQHLLYQLRRRYNLKEIEGSAARFDFRPTSRTATDSSRTDSSRTNSHADVASPNSHVVDTSEQHRREVLVQATSRGASPPSRGAADVHARRGDLASSSVKKSVSFSPGVGDAKLSQRGSLLERSLGGVSQFVLTGRRMSSSVDQQLVVGFFLHDFS